jgi:hypothetical protein
MATGLKNKPKPSRAKAAQASASSLREDVLYLYAISRESHNPAVEIAAEGIDGEAKVESVPCEGYLCWVSRVNRQEFADNLADRMNDLDWLALAGLRHQRAVSVISQQGEALPARFGTVFLSEATMAAHLRGRKATLQRAFELVASADEWGIKVFGTRRPRIAVAADAGQTSGLEYLKSKAETLQPKRSRVLDPEVQSFAKQLSEFSVASSPGGKASQGQPGLLWHGSFLVRRKDRPKLEALLSKFAKQWDERRRIECSGPWPPYSFVGAQVAAPEKHAD